MMRVWIGGCLLLATSIARGAPLLELLEYLGEWQDDAREVLSVERLEAAPSEVPEPVPQSIAECRGAFAAVGALIADRTSVARTRARALEYSARRTSAEIA